MLVVETRPVYSVAATERSFVLGVIRLEKRTFARMLVGRAAGCRLPTELAALIEDRLFEHYWAQTTAKSWDRTDALWRERHPALYWERYMTEDAVRTWCKLAESLNLTLAAREGPHDKRLADGRAGMSHPIDKFVVHIARTGRYAHGGVALRGSSVLHPPSSSSPDPLNPTASTEPFAAEDLTVTRLRSGICSMAVDAGRGTCNASFVPGDGGAHMVGSDREERFLEVEGFEEAVKAWDDSAVKKCAAVLGLQMVGGRHGEEDALKPRLRIVQSFASDTMG
ncbi:hypothetical protein SLS56_006262 [Neofusicoccum ribis]|uniref:Uncharacterized protein n=1 Tax=Neofusicoccum ribis TaxID=45134 RepID=A0ABR3SRA2_9PEZI